MLLPIAHSFSANAHLLRRLSQFSISPNWTRRSSTVRFRVHLGSKLVFAYRLLITGSKQVASHPSALRLARDNYSRTMSVVSIDL